MQNSTIWCNLFLTASKCKLNVAPPLALWLVATITSCIVAWFVWQLPLLQLAFVDQLWLQAILTLFPTSVAIAAINACAQQSEHFLLDEPAELIYQNNTRFILAKQCLLSSHFCYLCLINQETGALKKRLVWAKYSNAEGYAMLARMIRASKLVH